MDKVRAEYEDEQQEEEGEKGAAHSLAQVAEAQASRIPTSLVQIAEAHASRMPESECFAFFNPPSLEGYNETTAKWSRMFMELVQLMHAGERSRDKGGQH